MKFDDEIIPEVESLIPETAAIPEKSTIRAKKSIPDRAPIPEKENIPEKAAIPQDDTDKEIVKWIDQPLEIDFKNSSTDSKDTCENPE